MKRILSILLPAVLASAAMATALDSSLFSKTSTATVAGYAGAETLVDFPVLVALADNSPAGFAYADSAADGADLRFADADGNLIPHEIETWDSAGTSYVWVKVPSISGTATEFTLYYGADAATLPAVAAADVWSSYAAARAMARRGVSWKRLLR